jgi:5'-nucleotidase
MPFDLGERLVIGISTRALFDLSREDEIYRRRGLEAFRDYQKQNEDTVLQPGTAFPLVKALLSLNTVQPDSIEVLIISHNHPDVSLRVGNSIKYYGLDISRKAFTGGAPKDRFTKYLRAYKVSLFLSAEKAHVVEANDNEVPSALVYPGSATFDPPCGEIRIAFDADCVLFSSESENVYQRTDLKTFHQHEARNARTPLAAGPFASLLRKLAALKKSDAISQRIRLGLFTARNAPAEERVLRTLRDTWNVPFDEAHFLGGVDKAEILAAFEPHIFFDDQSVHCSSASRLVPTAQVLSTSGMEVLRKPLVHVQSSSNEEPSDLLVQFNTSCELFLGAEYENNREEFEEWFKRTIGTVNSLQAQAIVGEFAQSAARTPKGDQRRARNVTNTRADKLTMFLEQLFQKHTKGK